MPSNTTRRSGIFRASLRLDGFVAVEANYGDGSFITPPLRFAGELMEVNFDGGVGGWLWVVVLDEGNAPIVGYGLEEAEVVMSNGTAKEGPLARAYRRAGGADSALSL